MTVTRVGATAITSTGSSSGTLTPVYSQAPTVGNILTMGVIGVSSTSEFVLTTPPGWTAGPVGLAVSGSYIKVFLYWKVATGNDASPAMSFNTGGGLIAVIEEWASSSGWDSSSYDTASAFGVNGVTNTGAGTCNSGPLTTTAPGFIWSFTGALTNSVLKTYVWGGGSSLSSSSIVASNKTEVTGNQLTNAAGTYTPTLAFSGTGSWYAGLTASMAFKVLNVIAANVTAVPAIATSDIAVPVTGIGYSAFSVPAISTSDNVPPTFSTASSVSSPAAISTSSIDNVADSTAYTLEVISAVAISSGALVTLYWNGLTVDALVATSDMTVPGIPIPITPLSPIYTRDQYRLKFFEPTTIITRRIEILNADGVTLWDDEHGNPKRLVSGSVSVDYTRDERRSADLVLSNFDNALAHKPNGFWYDKVLRIWRGISFYDITGLHNYEVPIGEFMIDRVQGSRIPRQVKVTARDFTKKCLLSRFTKATSFANGTGIKTVIDALAVNAGISKRLIPVTGKTLGKDYMYERGVSRWEAMKDIAGAFGYELFFDAAGYLVMREYLDPSLSPVVHTFQTGPTVGNLVSWEKSANDTRIYNHVAVTGGDPDSIPVFAEAINTNPVSSTRVEKLGDRLYEYASAFITTVAQAQDVADKFLKIHALEEYEVSMGSIVAPWLEAGEIAQFIDPEAPLTDPDRFLMTAYTIPLGLEPMSATGRRITIVG